MRKLTPDEEAAYERLLTHGPFAPGDTQNSPLWQRAKVALDGLVRKRRATVEASDDGPRYTAVQS